MAVVFGLLNLLIGWLLGFVIGVVSLPLTCLTLGLFGFLVPVIVNAILLKLTDVLLAPFELKGWLPAFGMALLFGIGSVVIRWLE